ncbi:MAG: ABC transporter ATP-binding protein [Phycisphaeraceae bacterium]|nr:ABC transporter ATP-binding protein [Phycisphaeraceae bacterium]
MTKGSSRLRYRAYRDGLKRREADAKGDRSVAGVNPKRKKPRSFVALFAAFWVLLRGRRRILALGLATLSVSTVLALAVPSSTKVVIDYVLTDNPGPSGLPDWTWLPRERGALLFLIAIAMVGVTAVSIVIGMVGRWQVTRLTKILQLSLRRRAFEHAVRLPLHRVQQIKSGGLASIIREDAGGAAELLFSLIYNPWRAVVQLTGTLLILAWVDWKLLVGSLLLIPTVWISHKTWIARIRPVYLDIRKGRSAIDAHATEAFGGIRIVRGFARQHGEAARFARGNHLMARQEILAWWWSRAVDVAWQILIPGASAGLLMYGGSRVIGQTLTIGDLMMFSTYLLMLLSPLEAIVSSATSVQSQLAGLERTLDLFEEPREFEGGGASGLIQVSRGSTRGGITLRDVSFAYPGQTQRVIDRISIEIAPGETLALVGASGSGKTTLTNLIARFFDPSEGAVLLDGVDLREIDVASYRRLLGIVEQEVFLFDGTIAENIAYAERGASQERIVRAARIANAHGFIVALEKGYETLIGERGVRLSGGQKQRIALARAVLSDPRILILDEATSNLDSESEHAIQRSLGEVLKGRTTIVIAHRLSTIRNATRIAVLEAGRIVELGTHATLADIGGRYAELLRMQSLGDERSTGLSAEVDANPWERAD